MLGLSGGRFLIVYEFDSENYRVVSALNPTITNRFVKFNLDTKAVSLQSKFFNFELKNDFN
jgi:hypothetical protein